MKIFGGGLGMKKIKSVLLSLFIVLAFLPVFSNNVKAADGLILSYSPAPLTAGCIPELVDPTNPFTITITNTNGEPVDLTLNGEIEDRVVWNLLFKDLYPKTLPQYSWLRTDLHNDDGTSESNKFLLGFEPIKIDFSQANVGKYVFKGFCANDAGFFYVTAYTPDRRLAGSIKVEVLQPTVSYEIINTEDPERTVFYVPGDPDFNMTAGDNRVYEITASAKNAQGIPIRGIDRDINICGGVKEYARFTPFTTMPSNFGFTSKPERINDIFNLNRSNATFLNGNGGRYFLELGIDFNLNGKIDFNNKELKPMAGFLVRDSDAQGNIITKPYTTYYITSNVQWEDGTWQVNPQFDFGPPNEGWGLGSIYNSPYQGGYLFADINEDEKLDYHDSLLFDVTGRCKFYIYADDIAKLGGLVACNYYGDKDSAGAPPINQMDPEKITKRYNSDYVFYLDFDAFPATLIGSGKPKIIGYNATTGKELTRDLFNPRNYDLIYSIENHLEFRVIPTDLRDMPLEMDGIISLGGNQAEASIYGRLKKEPGKVSWISTTMFFTPTGLGEGVVWMDLYFENKNSPAPHSFKLEKVMYFDSTIGDSLEVNPKTIFVDEDNEVTITVKEFGTGAPVPNATVKINGCGASAGGKTNANGKYITTLKPLSLGEILVEASKENTMPGSTTIRVVKREVKLFLELDPLKSPTNKKTVSLTGRTLPLVNLQINNNDALVTNILADDKGYFTVPVDLSEGSNQIIITATKDKEIFKQSVVVVLDTTGPKIFIDPIDKLIDMKEVEITGRIEPGCKVFVNGMQAVVVNDIYKVIIPIQLQKNSIQVVGYDSLDNSSTEAIEVYNYHLILISLTIGQTMAKIDGKDVALDYPPFITLGRTFVPLRFITEAFGAKVEWMNPTQTILIQYGDITITMQIGNKTVFVNGKASLLDAPPVIKNGRTFVPLRFLSETFGCEILWNNATQEIVVKKLV